MSIQCWNCNHILFSGRDAVALYFCRTGPKLEREFIRMHALGVFSCRYSFLTLDIYRGFINHSQLSDLVWLNKPTTRNTTDANDFVHARAYQKETSASRVAILLMLSICKLYLGADY